MPNWKYNYEMYSNIYLQANMSRVSKKHRVVYSATKYR